MALRAKKPEPVNKRLKLFMYGVAGSGKSMAAIQMPRPYIIDTEKGVEQAAYVQLINQAKGAVFQTSSADDVVQELKSLLTEKHDFVTVVIDAVTNIEDNVVQYASLRYDADAKEGGDMRVWRDRDKAMRRISSMLLALDMNVVMTAHSKIQYGENMVKLGRTFEGWKKWDYLFDLVLELSVVGTKRIAKVIKTRMAEFPDQETFEWSYAELARRLGDNGCLESPAKPTVLASKEQVVEIKQLLDTVKMEPEWAEKCLMKANVDTWEDMPADKIEKCIKMVRAKLNKTEGKAE